MTIFDLLIKSARKNLFQTVIGWKKRERLFHFNFEEYIEEIEYHISVLKSMGIKKGSYVAIMADTSHLWHLFDMAIMAIGAISVPVYTTFQKNELIDVFRLIDIDLFITDREIHLTKLELLNFDNSILFTGDINREHKFNHFFDYRDLIEEAYRNDCDIVLKEIIKDLSPDECCSLLLTSGTTGTAKGVIVTHEALYNLLLNLSFFMEGKITKGSKSLTSLPLAHVLGRCDSFLHISLPVQTFFGENIETLGTDIKLIKPTYLITVPRILEKIKNKIMTSIGEQGLLYERLFRTNIGIADSFHEKLEKGLSPSLLDKKAFLYSQNFFFKKIRNQIGENISFFVCGGAPLSEETFAFFRNIGLPVLEGYGLTETLGPVTVNPIDNPRRGTVGKPLKNINIAFGLDGEILIKGDSLFKAYLHDDSSSFTEDGYFATGDIGEIDSQGHLKITDRKKDLIVTSNGKNIAPQKIETLMMSCPHIEHFMAIGEGRHFLTGLVSINKTSFNELFNTGVLDSSSSYEDLAQNPHVIEIIKNDVERLNNELPKFEQIKKFMIIPFPLDAGGDYLTPSLKLKKQRLYNKFKKEIDLMYQSEKL